MVGSVIVDARIAARSDLDQTVFEEQVIGPVSDFGGESEKWEDSGPGSTEMMLGGDEGPRRIVSHP